MASTLLQFSQLGHHFDSRWRRYRCVLNFTRYRRYREWLARQVRELPDAGQPLVLFDLADTRIDGPQGRRFYHLFIYFVRAGFFPLLRENYLFLNNMEKRFKSFCAQEKFAVIKRDQAINRPYILVTDKPALGPLPEYCTKRISVNYTPGYCAEDADFPLAFPMFPAIYKSGQDLRLAELRTQPRQCAVFFGGDAQEQKYNKSSLQHVYKVLPRAQVLAILRQQLPEAQWSAPANQQQLMSCLSQPMQGLLVVNTRHCKIQPHDWLKTLARADFFLACPGVRYPMSHNAIEALAVGTVPILQYPELFFPPLEDGKNCLVYRDEKELVEVVQKAMSLTRDQISALAQGAVAYYEAHLAPLAVMEQLLNYGNSDIRLRIMPSTQKGGGFI